MLWVDPTDPSVFVAVTGMEMVDPLDEEMLADVRHVIAVASEILTLATAHLIHPAGSQTEEYLGRGIRRLQPVYGPMTGINSLTIVALDDTETPVTGYRRHGNMIVLPNARGFTTPLWRTNEIYRACAPEETVYRLDYSFASTITRAARQAVLDYARQLWLALEGSDECRLPERTTSVTREGIGIELLTPQDFLDKGRTGLPFVDEWLAQVNSKRALRPSGVYTPDAPPGIGTRLRRASWS